MSYLQKDVCCTLEKLRKQQHHTASPTLANQVQVGSKVLTLSLSDIYIRPSEAPEPNRCTPNFAGFYGTVNRSHPKEFLRKQEWVNDLFGKPLRQLCRGKCKEEEKKSVCGGRKNPGNRGQGETKATLRDNVFCVPPSAVPH
ncbi:hypothetical protein CDAR_87351 [Caerostris darwini]|uniref:Uncharacterized protein n=1 Tax=Caerostris darwini TaxID=1538125 RepID=A0AAV4U835_9ARAC|nr:hypothetical protein CDAR_87351 [Caerostris darwini]